MSTYRFSFPSLNHEVGLVVHVDSLAHCPALPSDRLLFPRPELELDGDVPVDVNSLTSVSPTASQVLHDVFVQLTGPEHRMVEPVMNPFLSQPKRGASFAVPVYADGSPYPTLEAPVQLISDRVLDHDRTHREMEETPTDLMAPTGSYKSAVTVMLHYPSLCVKSLFIHYQERVVPISLSFKAGCRVPYYKVGDSTS
jgi:hypothetical protein